MSSISGSIPSQCKICQEKFPSRSRLFAHLRADHEPKEFDGANDEPSADGADAKDASALSLNQRQEAEVLARSALSNADFEAYYAIQSSKGRGYREGEGGIMSESEWTEAMQCFRSALPLSFRINRSSFHSTSIQQHLIDRLFDAAPPDAISPVPSVPDQYVASIPSRFWNEDARKLLADAQELGALHRQEVVSAIPALLLGVQSHHAVLDLCAAPGSKTLQLLDMMHHQNGEGEGDFDCTKLPTGILAANDPARNRLLSLTRRSRRQPRSPLITSASDGRYFPTLRKNMGYKLKFDRVLCDAPCSGDGTMRKLSSKEWKAWSVKNGITLHKLQVRLLVRALKAVKRGGRVLYSTCSLNPIEDEAVVVEAIRQCSNETDSYSILPLPNILEGAKEEWRYCPGSTTWVVPDSKFKADTNPTVYESYNDVPAERRKGKAAPLQSMFCPKTRKKGEHHPATDGDSGCELLTAELATELEMMLPHTARILPQHLNSGGFFCALIERTEATFYGVCLEQKEESTCMSSNLHGKIYHHVETARQIRDLIRAQPLSSDTDGSRIRHIYEGFPSLQHAQIWLKRNGAYVAGVSDAACELPEIVAHESIDTEQKSKRPRYNSKAETNVGDGVGDEDLDTSERDHAGNNVSDERQSAQAPLMYSHIFKKPHPSLLVEFCEFYGLDMNLFPAKNIRMIGRGAGAENISSFPTINADTLSVKNGAEAKHRIKYLQLVIMSSSLSSVNAGGATFTPIESGLGLCFVPTLAALNAESASIAAGVTKVEEKDKRRCVKFNLLDEAAEIVGRHATKRVIALSTGQAATLLSLQDLPVGCADASIGVDLDLHAPAGAVGGASNWLLKSRWGKHQLSDAQHWESGGIVAVCAIDKKRRSSNLEETPGNKTGILVFLSCSLMEEEGKGKVLKLPVLADSNLYDSLRRAVVEVKD